MAMAWQWGRRNCFRQTWAWQWGTASSHHRLTRGYGSEVGGEESYLIHHARLHPRQIRGYGFRRGGRGHPRKSWGGGAVGVGDTPGGGPLYPGPLS